MSKRGRPKTNGSEPLWMWTREAWAIHFYDRARQSGDKHSGAVTQAVTDVREMTSKMRISETEVKRIHASWRSRSKELVFFANKPHPNEKVIFPDGRIATVVLTVSVGPHPNYVRVNAVQKEI